MQKRSVRAVLAWVLLLPLLVGQLFSGCATTPEPEEEPKGKVDRLGEIREQLVSQPDNPDLHFEYGNLLFDLGNYAEASKAYERAIEKRPDFAKAYTNLGIVLQRMDNHRAAVGAFETALDQDPADMRANEGLMVSAKQIGDSGRVLDSARRLAESQPDKADVVAGYAALLLQYKHYPEAAEVYRRVIELDPSFPGDHYNLGLCHYQQGALDPAEAAWRKAVEINPDFPEANRGLAVIAYDRGNYDAAWEQVRACVQRGIAVEANFLKALEEAAPVFQPEP